VGHHGGRGTTAAAMVHRVLLIDMCLVLDLCLHLLEQSLGKIAQAKERKHKHTTFNCIHWIDDWLQSHPCEKLVEYHQLQFHRQPP
jgi:hypothetical protein